MKYLQYVTIFCSNCQYIDDEFNCIEKHKYPSRNICCPQEGSFMSI